MLRTKNALKLVVIDRDGTLNTYREGYIKSPEEFEAIPGSLEAVALLNRAGWHVVVASNQPGLGRGVMDMAALNAIHTVMPATRRRRRARRCRILLPPQRR